jgi:hemerythrin
MDAEALDRSVLVAYMEWRPDYEVGFAPIDEEHRSLVEALNQLYEAREPGKEREKIGEILTSLRDYTVTHFKTEESLMIQFNFPGAAAHFAAHAELVIQVSDLVVEFRSSRAMVTDEVMAFLETWLVEHIQTKDKELGRFLASRGAF